MGTSNSKTACRILSSSLLLATAACSGISAQECRSTEWYSLGYRDGDVYGIRPQVDQYAHRCGSLPASAQSAYMAGWTDGYAEFAARVQKNESP